MLVKFTVENYRGFSKPIELDFSETHDYKFNNQCIRNGLLTKAVIYGPNSSGKTNLGLALFDIVGLLTDKSSITSENSNPGTYINADSGNRDAVFTYIFKKNSDLIKYSYRKSSMFQIAYEELYINNVKVYSYDFISRKKEFEKMSIINAESLNFEYFENNFAILRYVANNTIQAEDSYVKFIMNFVSNMLWFRCLQTNGFIGLTNEVVILEEWIAQNNLAKEFQAFLKKLANIDTDLEVAQINAPNPTKMLIEKHKTAGFIFSDVASSGTKALELLFYWSKRFKDVSFLFLDEFDAYYHFNLAKNVIRLISKYDDMQAVFTTHNSALASNELLRPDCYFVLNNNKLTSFVDSTERELREGHNLEKMLRNGEFDA